MKSVMELNEEQQGAAIVVIPKIREVYKSLGNVVLVYDNGDKRNIDTNDANTLMQDIMRKIELYYTTI